MRTLAAVVVATLLAAGCTSAPPVERLLTVRGQGFLVQHDGSLDARAQEQLFSELATSRDRISKVLGPGLAPGDFRSFEDRRHAGCPAPPPGDVRVLVLREAGRCHADDTGITLTRSHLERKDATHELVHYLAGGSWRPIDEGLAVYVTELLHGPAWGVSIDVRARAYLDVGLDEPLDRERLRCGMTRRDYDVAGSFVKFLVEELGWPRFLEVYRAAPGDYHGVYGVAEQELVARWRERIVTLNVRQDASYYRFKAHLTTKGDR